MWCGGGEEARRTTDETGPAIDGSTTSLIGREAIVLASVSLTVVSVGRARRRRWWKKRERGASCGPASGVLRGRSGRRAAGRVWQAGEADTGLRLV